jgi:uncharacterized protein involved in response to NO
MIAAPSPTCAPYRPFFLLAALDAILGAVVWLPWIATPGELAPNGLSPGEWHRDVLLFGTVPAILAGFLLTALPRWTGGPRLSAASLRALVGLWLSARAVFLFASPRISLVLFAGFVLILLVIVAARVLAANDDGNRKIALLLFGFLASIVLAAMQPNIPLADRLALTALVGLLIVIGGRVTPALTTAYLRSVGRPVILSRSAGIELAAAGATTSALVAYVVMPRSSLTAVLGGLAATAQARRLMQWQAWRCVAVPSLLALHLGYCWIVAGFALLALHAAIPSVITQASSIHAWTIGGLGTMALAIMASMIRRHSGRAFANSYSATAAFISMTLCAVARLLAEFLPGQRSVLAALAGAFWIAAFALFLAAFSRLLLKPT